VDAAYYGLFGVKSLILTMQTRPSGSGQREPILPVTVSRSDGVLEYWSDGLSLVNSIHQRDPMTSD
jgi:hypothetical protein